MNKFIIKNFKGGISQFNDRGLPGAYFYGYNLDVLNEDNVLKPFNKFEVIGQGVISDLILWLVPSITGKIYGFGSAGKIYEINGTSVSLKYTEPQGTIKGASEWYLSNGNAYLFWATDTYLNQKLIPGASDWSDVNSTITIGSTNHTFPKTNLSSTDWHTMVMALGQLLIANKEKIALVGYDCSYTNEALRIFRSDSIKTLLPRQNSVLIGTKRENNDKRASLFTWDTISLSWNSQKMLYTSPIHALIDTDIPFGVSGDGELIYTDLINTIPIQKIKGGGKVNPGAITCYKNMAIFGLYNNVENKNGLYTYGRIYKDDNHILNLISKVDATEIGAVLNYNDTLYFSYRNGSNYYLLKQTNQPATSCYYQSLRLIPDQTFQKDHIFVGVNVLFNPDIGSQLQVMYRINGIGNFKIANTKAGDYCITDGSSTSEFFNIGEKGRFIEVAFYITPTATTSMSIKMLEVYFN